MAAYHSNMDSYYWVSHFDKNAFEYHATQARVMALMVKRFAEDIILPLNWTDYATALNQGVAALISHANRTKPGIDAPTLFAPLTASVGAFVNAAKGLDKEIAKATAKGVGGLAARAINDRLMLAERAFIDYNGLNNRQMLRNVVWAPGSFDSYSAELFPSISDAITLGQWEVVSQQINYVTIFVDASSGILRGDVV